MRLRAASAGDRTRRGQCRRWLRTGDWRGELFALGPSLSSRRGKSLPPHRQTQMPAKYGTCIPVWPRAALADAGLALTRIVSRQRADRASFASATRAHTPHRCCSNETPQLLLRTMAEINGTTLAEIAGHFASLRAANRLHGLNYERCAELPFVIDILRSRFAEPLSYLDIGSGGESPLPTYLLRRSNWNVQCIDKFDWVRRREARRTHEWGPGSRSVRGAGSGPADRRSAAGGIHVITNISVISTSPGRRTLTQWLDQRACSSAAARTSSPPS